MPAFSHHIKTFGIRCICRYFRRKGEVMKVSGVLRCLSGLHVLSATFWKTFHGVQSDGVKSITRFSRHIGALEGGQGLTSLDDLHDD